MSLFVDLSMDAILYIYIYVDPELNVYVDQIYRIYKCGGLILLNYVELGSNW